MVSFNDDNDDQTKMPPVLFGQHVFPISIERSLSDLIENKLELRIFNARYPNDDDGRHSLKDYFARLVTRYTSSRNIEQLCRDNILFTPVFADSQPYFTTIAEFIASSAGNDV